MRKGEIKMNKICEKEYYLRARDFDKFGNIKASNVLELFEDAAGQHGEELGVGFDDMLKKNYMWAIVRTKFEIISAPKKYQKVIIKTWPLKANRLSYRRECVIEDENGNKLIIGSSEWVVIDCDKRKFVMGEDVYPFTEGFLEEKNFEGKLPRIRDFETVGEPFKVRPRFCELDMNNHVNNTKYPEFVFDAINPQQAFEIKDFLIEYKKEILSEMEIDIFFIENEKEIMAKGQNSDGEIMFDCRITYK